MKGGEKVYKVAAASSDGKRINEHFSKTSQFLIYDLQLDGSFQYIESRRNASGSSYGEHEEDALQSRIGLVADCAVVLVSRIGIHAERLLNQKGIRSFAVEEEIEKTLEDLAGFYRRTLPGKVSSD